jgi:FkbM family methyltransferase
MFTPYQVLQDRKIESWKLVSTTPIKVEIPDFITSGLMYKVQQSFTDNNIVETSCKYQKKFYVYRNDVIIGQSIRLYGEYTQIELDLLKHFCKPDTIVYDVGANIGYHSVGFASMAKHVYCFEPNDKHYKLLGMNTKHLPNVSMFRQAIGDYVGTTHVSDFDLNKPGNYGEAMLQNAGQVTDICTIDSLQLPKPHIIKMDTEGFEYKVLLGATETIKNHKPIIFYESHNVVELDLIYDLLHGYGYNIYWMASPNFNPNNFNKNQTNVFGFGGVVNCLAMPDTYPLISNLAPVIDRNDTHIKFFERMRNMNKGV